MRRTNHKEKRGIALIVAIGVLGLLAIIGTYFARNMQLEYKIAANYLRSVQAKYLAELGIQKAIADIRKNVKTLPYDDLVKYVTDYSTEEQELSEGGSYQIFIGAEDGNKGEDEKVNLNTLDATDYIGIDALKAAGLSYNQIAKIIDYCDIDKVVTSKILTSNGVVSATGNEDNDKVKNAPFALLEELKLVSGIGDTTFQKIRDEITIFCPVIRGGLVGNYYSDTGGFNKNTILDLANYKGKVIELGKFESIILPCGSGESDGEWESSRAFFAGCYLVNYLSSDAGIGFCLNSFGVRWQGYLYIPSEKTGSSINFSATPNDGIKLYIDEKLVLSDWENRDSGDAAVTGSYKVDSGGWHPVIVEYYHNEENDEAAVDLKWDALGAVDYIPAENFGYSPPSYVGPYPETEKTETVYNDAGIYEIISIGRVKKDSGEVLAEKKIRTVVKIFGTWMQTARSEFGAPWYGEINDYSDGEVLNVTWMDSCPLDIAQIDVVEPNALKLGFWDNFDEDIGCSLVNLCVVDRETFTGEPDGEIFTNYDLSNDDNEFKIQTDTTRLINRQEVAVNSNFYKVNFKTQNMYLRVWERDDKAPFDRKAEMWNVGWLYPLWESEKYYYCNDLLDEWRFADSTDLPDSNKIVFSKDYSDIATGAKYNLTYAKEKVLKIIYKDGKFGSYVDNGPLLAELVRENVEKVVGVAIGTFNAFNEYPPLPPKLFSELTTYWDDFRMIPSEGFFYSPPFCETSKVAWGCVSWNEGGSGDVSFEARTGDALEEIENGEVGWKDISNGQPLSDLSNSRLLQYKVVMADNNQDGKTPVFGDVTITYLPEVEILSWREDMD